MKSLTVWQKTAATVLLLVLAVVYVCALWPAVATRSHADAEFLLAAQSLAHGHGFPPAAHFPPLFPALLALFALVSTDPHWLKLLPLLCAAGWFRAITALLRRMGASPWAAFLIACATLAAPGVVDAATSLSAEPLFALLITMSLVLVLDGRMAMAGVVAGLSVATSMAGVTLIAACILILTLGRRLGDAVRYTVAAMAVAAPAIGWTVAHAGAHYGSWNVLTGLHASEKAAVLGHNAYWIALAPFELLSGVSSENAAAISTGILLWSWFRRRLLMPDLFLFLYLLAVAGWSWLPTRSLTVVLPFVLWLAYRAFRGMRSKEAFAAFVVLGVGLPVGCSLYRIPLTLRPDPAQPLYAWIRTNTPANATILANLDANMALQTGRASVRGIDPTGYDLWYAPRAESAVNAAMLLRTVRVDAPDYVVITPDDNLPESAPWRKAVEALERAGVLEAVPVPGLSKECRLLRTVGR